MAWWASSISAATKVVDVDDDKESLIDLTSDNEDAPSPAAAGAASSSSSSSGGLQVLSPWAIKMNAKEDVKSEGIKRAAEASKKAQQSGEVTVTCKPSEKIDEVVSRPAKRSKSGGGGGAAGSSSSSSQEAEEDLELVGTTGTARLPHNRFACTEHKFEGPHGSSSHKEKCSLCYCYVCDRLASACVEWTDHCHATDSGPMRSSWKSLRERAKALLLAGRRPPVSGRYSSGSSSHASGGASRSSPSQPSQGGSSGGGSSGSGSGSSGSGSAGSVVSPSSEARAAKAAAAAAARLPNACNCEELCKPVHDIFLPVQQPGSFTGVSPRPSAAIVYLEGLTPQQVKHVENISITSTVERAAKREVRRAGPPLSKAHYHNLIEAAEKKWRPELRVVAAGANRSNVTVVTASRDSRSLRTVFVPKWTPGAATPVAVRLGGSKSIGFEVSSSSNYGTPSSKREEYFNRFVSKKPLPPTLWFSITRAPSHDDRVGSGALSILKVEDRYLLENLKYAYEMEFIDIKAKASFDHVANTGSFSLEVVLLGKVFARGTTLTTRKGVADLVPLVERFVLDRTYKPPSRSDASVYKKKPPSWIVNGAGGGGGGAGSSASAPVGLGRKFTPSSKRYGGYASLDVSLAGLVDSVREEELSPVIAGRMIIHPAKMLLDLENQQHRSLPQQPDCLTVELYEHQKQDAQWMMDQEMLEGGSMQHLWAEVPLPPSAPSSGHRVNEFRRCWFSPVLNLFTLENPFTSTMKGGILCDEMGLGKTAATLCLHLIHPAKTPAPGVPLDEAEWGPIEGAQASKLSDLPGSILAGTERPGKWVSKGTLVVCKVSLVGQWVEEAKRLCGGALTIYPYHGQGRSKDPSFLAKFDVVVTTYGVVQADASRNAGYPPLRRIRWWRVVLDESHTIASTSSTTNVVKQLISNRRWCMTGTPYISRFSDVNGQLAFVGAGGQFRAQDLGDKGANFSTQAETVAFLRRVLLRHSQGMKLDGHSILGLPTITHKVEVLIMPTREREAYVDFEKGVQSDYCKVRHRLRNMAGSHTMEVLTLLSKFRQACSGGQLLIGDSAGGGGSSSSVDAFCPVCNEVLESPVKTYCGHTFCQACITSVLTKHRSDEAPCPKCKKAVRLGDLRIVGGGGGASSSAVAAGGGTSYGAKPEPYQRYGGSGGGGSSSSGSSSSSSHKPAGAGIVMETKLRALVEKLADIHRQDPTSKSLVFSQFNSSLEWLKRTLPKRGFQFRTLTGAMTRNQRTAALNAFAKDPPTTVFLLSVRSGAVGINLTQANNVFLLEPLLNLALEKQAIGRVYRLGQARPVRVTKLVLKDSIETRILDLQKKQASGGSASAAIGAPSSSGSNGVAGNIARDNAKNLKIEEYNALFGVTEG